MAGKFSLAEHIAKGVVPDLGTSGREQIEYIDIDRIDDDPSNFYELSGPGGGGKIVGRIF